jgi:hypothetical protein
MIGYTVIYLDREKPLIFSTPTEHSSLPAERHFYIFTLYKHKLQKKSNIQILCRCRHHRSFWPELDLRCLPQFCLILFCVSQHRWRMGQQKGSSHSRLSPELHIMGTERRAQVRLTSSVFKTKWAMYSTGPQLNLRSIWACCAVIL